MIMLIHWFWNRYTTFNYFLTNGCLLF